ncbi:MAG: murein biosynthesis integral membrane protein MurJ [Rhodospirillales bacterium]|jgi:putative peptidoglycan lipid II flippase|nr:murein biosynthesis integral membrane protein MurJ [Rhodospirillaceae bacterium]MDP6429911.1 murein biosynthesis integral membrane protein MurJ [Rhodospirillales bacterium]MDP6642623.1 murein biosynthesis integral membrane protein MurJ [Rhodospirillales bacterium]MDP6840551.1 murein biosynthesis integral membrane protein MurJ [Rhodospirillales bacterium]
MALFGAISTIGGYTMGSRILGFIRDILVAAILGAGPVADAFFVAFKLPNLFRRLFAEGAFSAAFVPLFARKLEGAKLEGGGRAEAEAFARQALAILFWSLSIVVVAAEIGMPWIIRGLAPGFTETPERFQLAVIFTRITFPYLMFVSLVALFSGVMNSLEKFWQAAATPILLNLCLIGAVLGLAPLLPSPGHALAWGVFAAGIVQFAWMWAHLRRAGIRLGLGRPRLSDDVKLLLVRMAPVAVGAGIYQVNLLIDMVIASLLPPGSISFLFFADRVNQLPLGVIGVAVGTALLPLLSRQLRAGDMAAAENSQNRALEISLFLTLPAAAALLVISQPIVSVLFERGAFDAAASGATARALAAYAWGIPAYVLIKTLSTSFFAAEDTKTPIVIGVAAMIVNVILNLVLMGPFLHVGIAMATAISSWLNAGLLALVLIRRRHFTLDARLRRRLPRMIVASGLMALVLWLAQSGLEPWLAGGTTLRIGALVLLVVGGLAAYGVAALLTGAASTDDLNRILRRKAA